RCRHVLLRIDESPRDFLPTCSGVPLQGRELHIRCSCLRKAFPERLCCHCVSTTTASTSLSLITGSAPGRTGLCAANVSWDRSSITQYTVTRKVSTSSPMAAPHTHHVGLASS